MGRHLLIPAILFLALTAAGEWLLGYVDLTPLNPVMAREAAIDHDALGLLLRLAVPVGAFVLAALLYGVVAFRQRGEPSQDGPPIRGHARVAGLWLAVTGALCLLVIVTPGITGLAAMAQSGSADLVVKATAQRWSYTVAYPQYGITAAQELVLPVNQRVKFEITSRDVVHGFWIPAFRVKKDAVPGLTTELYVTPTHLGTFEDDFNLRVQCSQLCGLAHAVMRVPVRVVTEPEFRAWIARSGS